MCKLDEFVSGGRVWPSSVPPEAAPDTALIDRHIPKVIYVEKISLVPVIISSYMINA